MDAYATERHYLDHLRPVYNLVNTLHPGTLWLAGAQYHGQMRAMTRAATPTLVASWWDSITARRMGRPVIYLEHGAGQTYGDGAHASYSGGPDHEGTVLFLCPNEAVALRWRTAYPQVPAVVVGCPKLDSYHSRRVHWVRPPGQPRTVAISFHSNAALLPETAGAFNAWEPHLPAVVADLQANGWHVLGHSHPRLWRKAQQAWAQAGAEPVADFTEVLERADVYVADNTSTLPEAASCGIPLVWVWAPWWRPEVNHGGRFGDWVGDQVQCDSWVDLAEMVNYAASDPADAKTSRQAMVRKVYAHTDGHATYRAADAILKVLGSTPPL